MFELFVKASCHYAKKTPSHVQYSLTMFTVCVHQTDMRHEQCFVLFCFETLSSYEDGLAMSSEPTASTTQVLELYLHNTRPNYCMNLKTNK